MATSLRTYRQDVGRELGMVKYGTATSVTTTLIADTSADSWMDTADSKARYNEAGVLVDDGTTLHFRQNVTYNTSTPSFTIGAISGLSGTPYFEIHTEPLLHPLNNWPYLINEGLRRIRRISLQTMLLNGRGYYDMGDYSDLTAPSQFRRLYNLGSNLLLNADMASWPTGDNGPSNWTPSAAVARLTVLNYGHGTAPLAGVSLYQEVKMGGSKRVKITCWGQAVSGGTGTLTVTSRLADDSTERSVNKTVTATTGTRMEIELELTDRTKAVRVNFAAATQQCFFWAPTLVVLSQGKHERITPVSAMNADRTVRLWVPKPTGVGELALLLPEQEFTIAATNAADVATVNAPYELAKASITVQVLRFLVQHPEIPSASKRDYLTTLAVWQTTFNNRIREHHRRIAKSTSVWETGELN